jgi:hypothetical protein
LLVLSGSSTSAREVPEVYILGKPLVSVVAFGSEVVDILEVGDRLSKKGWHCAFVSMMQPRANAP